MPEQNSDLSLLPFPQSRADESLLIDLTDAAPVITHYPAPGTGFNGDMDKALPAAVMPGSSLTRPWLGAGGNLAAPGTLQLLEMLTDLDL